MRTRKIPAIDAQVTQALVDKIVTILDEELPLGDGRR
jgi:hypothetical protein